MRHSGRQAAASVVSESPGITRQFRFSAGVDGCGDENRGKRRRAATMRRGDGQSVRVSISGYRIRPCSDYVEIRHGPAGFTAANRYTNAPRACVRWSDKTVNDGLRLLQQSVTASERHWTEHRVHSSTERNTAGRPLRLGSSRT